MEQEAAKVLWGRSVSKYGLQYVEMLSDSSAFKAIRSPITDSVRKVKTVAVFIRKPWHLVRYPPRHTDHPSSTFLCTAVAHKMIPVYRRMSDEALLRRMTHGGTQNTNECPNATIWARCPKTSFRGM
ncbi:hypothetical protein ACOMHN_047133 [Nucella lapillus]